MREFGDCETVYNNSTKVLCDPGSKNNRSKFRLENPKKAKFRVVKIDGCVIKEGIRCDYLVILSNKYELYIELKGSNVKHAIEQITTTIQKITADKSSLKSGFIASTRCPITSPEIQILKKKLRKKYNAKLIIKNGEITHKI